MSSDTNYEGPFVTLDDVLDDALQALLAVEQEYIDAEGKNLSADTINLVYKALTGVTKYDAVD